MAFRIGIVGDLHTYWDDLDNAQIDQRAYDLLLFTGDLGGGTHESCLRIAQSLSHLRSPALVMPGNNDTVDVGQLAAELRYRRGLRRLQALRRDENEDRPDPAEGARLCGYSQHRFTRSEIDFTVIAGRPHSMGGPELAFPEHMREHWGIPDLEASRDRLISLVESSETDRLIFLSHNGPTGLGERPDSIWGCDFRAGGGDWGDPDLRDAIDHARSSGKQVVAVVAGHMHLRTRGGALRPWRIDADETLYLNPARVPRIFPSEAGSSRHHLEMSLSPEGVSVEERILDSA